MLHWLWIKINNEYVLTELGKIGTEIDGGSGLAHSTFLVDEGIDASHVVYGFTEFKSSDFEWL